MVKNTTQWTDDGYGDSGSASDDFLVDDTGDELTDESGNTLGVGLGTYTAKASTAWDLASTTAQEWAEGVAELTLVELQLEDEELLETEDDTVIQVYVGPNMKIATDWT